MTVVVAALAMWSAGAAAQSVIPFDVKGDAIEEPLAGLAGDVGRGRVFVVNRAMGNCLICHVVPEPDERFMGDIGPSLAGVGSRLTVGQLRLRLVDQSRINPQTVMPPYYRTEGLYRVAPRIRGQPAFTARMIEDVVAYLATLKE